MPRLLTRLIPFGTAGLMPRFPARFVPFRMADLMSRLLVGLVRETFQAYANADPANSREDEINAEDKSENVEGLVLANAPG
jgi:hypothetical protein